jgi:hypothetical protein
MLLKNSMMLTLLSNNQKQWMRMTSKTVTLTIFCGLICRGCQNGSSQDGKLISSQSISSQSLGGTDSRVGDVVSLTTFRTSAETTNGESGYTLRTKSHFFYCIRMQKENHHHLLATKLGSIRPIQTPTTTRPSLISTNESVKQKM